jgi:hypothetical protein
MDSKTLTFLLRGGHLNMPERVERGMWPHPPLKLSDVVRRLASVLESERWFPREWKPAVPGEPVWEGGVIERQSASKYVYRAQRPHPAVPNLLAEETEEIFTAPQDAARHYLKWDLILPGDLDGWKVVA